jgi:hypothetical protein
MNSPNFLHNYEVKGLSKISCYRNTKIARNNTLPIQNFVLIYQGGQEFKGTIDLQHKVMSQDKSLQADRRQTCVLMNQATHVPALLITY